MARTEIAAIGKQTALERLFEDSGYKNENTSATAHKILLEGCDFDLVYTPLKHLGYKAVLCILGELYAALRQPDSLSGSL